LAFGLSEILDAIRSAVNRFLSRAVQRFVALGTLAELFTDRPVVGIHAVDLVLGFGSLHCLTQQQPA
jgi:hypothetical protein